MAKKKQKIQSFFIRDKNKNESKKVQLRQKLVKKCSGLNDFNLQELFQTNLPIKEVGNKNCENVIGSVEIPLGVTGPITTEVSYFKETGAKDSLSNHKSKSKTFIIPLATTEGALIASIHRGLKVLDNSKTRVLVKKVGMSRSVVFECDSANSVQEFIDFFKMKEALFAQYCEETSSHLKYLSYEFFTRGKLLFFRFVFDTDEAMGMNMVTIALSHAWKKLSSKVPKNLSVQLVTLSGNVCTDKKDSVINRLFGRGYAVTVEAWVAKSDLKSILKVEAKKLVKTHNIKNVIGSNVAGSLSQNMHVANALSAFYLATGQDIAHTVAGSEASVHFEDIADSKSQEGVYVSLTLPNISVGSVGGGTWLPAQKQARSIIEVSSSKLDKKSPIIFEEKRKILAKDLAAVAGLACLAGEISGLAALTTNTLAKAHEELGRSKTYQKNNTQGQVDQKSRKE